jgi:hypothetical protein
MTSAEAEVVTKTDMSDVTVAKVEVKSVVKISITVLTEEAVQVETEAEA